MASYKPPKQWKLGKVEDLNSFENWQQNQILNLSFCPDFAIFLADGVSWDKSNSARAHRGLTSDGNDVAQNDRRTAAQKLVYLNLMLDQLACYCPVISRNSIKNDSTSIQSVWQMIRAHFGFQQSGAHFLDFSEIHYEADERPEDLFQRILTFVDDNLLKARGAITHHGEQITTNEQKTPSLENMIVLHWLSLIHKALPKLVKQRYATELRTRTLASIKPEISQALSSLLEELQSIQDVRNMQATVNRTYATNKTKTPYKKPSSAIKCPLCSQAGRKSDHFLSKCRYLPEEDRKYLSKARNVDTKDDYCTSDNESEASDDSSARSIATKPKSQKVDVFPSPFLDAFYKSTPVRIVIDGGATGDFMSLTEAKRLGITIQKSSMNAIQADGECRLDVVGEVNINFRRDDHILKFNGLVVKKLDEGILGGTPFQENNDIGTRVKKHLVSIGDDPYYYKPGSNKKQAKAFLVRSNKSTTVWPEEDIKLQIPDQLPDDEYYLEPRYDTNSDKWLYPCIVRSVGGEIVLSNKTDLPINIPKHKHICQVRAITQDMHTISNQNQSVVSSPNKILNSSCNDLYKQISIDPQNHMDRGLYSKFEKLHAKYNTIFDSHLPGYNGAFGPNEAVVNMGPTLPPQRKGRLPLYKKDDLDTLQSKFDELESLGVLATPEEAGVHVEYLNPSFLVKKPRGGHRLVTSFGDVGRYAKPQPALMPNMENTLYEIGQWKYIICTDLSKAFYQIVLSQSSRKYCGVVTPFRGVRVYCRAAMGMPGSEAALEELMCKVVGKYIQQGVAAKIADNLYVGGSTAEELLQNWENVLQALSDSNLKLSPNQTVINPHEVSILGWVWNNGTLRASSHKVSALATCDIPKTVRQLRSYIGAYKVLSRVIKHSSQYLDKLEAMTANNKSSDILQWTDSLLAEFSKAQKSLSTNKVIKIPRRNEQLWIVPDGAQRCPGPGIAATLYSTDDINGQCKPQLAGFFSAKLKSNQSQWQPCEIEGLAIACAVNHWSPYIIQSMHKACVLTDSKPCCQAHEKLCRGEFSTNPRVATFLSAVTRYQVSIRHISGINNSLSDFGSRNTTECNSDSCKICAFINEISNSVVRNINISDLIAGRANIPYLSRGAWHESQQECPALRRAHAHLKNGTRPSKKTTNIKDVKRYLNVATIARDGLLVVKSKDAYSTGERIIIPRSAVDGLLTALHIKLDHPLVSQLKAVCKRYFYALDFDKHIEINVNSCHHCASLKKIPHTMIEQSSSDPPEVVGASFSCDIMRREKQYIMITREYITSFTAASIIKDEAHSSLRDCIIEHVLPIHARGGPAAVVRSDGGTGFVHLENDPVLKKHGISVEIGRRKNKNKNPIAERGVQELEEEITKLEPSGGPITNTTLVIATANLNAKLRSRGLSSREMLYQRDQFTQQQIPVNDLELIVQQQNMKEKNQPSSMLSKNPQKYLPVHNMISVGDLVYLYNDRDKHRARDRYLVISVDNDWCNIRKFVGNSLRKMSYRVKCSECYKVPVPVISQNNMNDHEESDKNSDIEDDVTIEPRRHKVDYSMGAESLTTEPPIPPDIPPEILSTEDVISSPAEQSKPTCIQVPHTRTSSRPRKRAVLDEGSVCSICLKNPCTCIS